MTRKFALLLLTTYRKLKACNVPVEELRVYLTELSVSRKENVPLFSKQMAEIIVQTSLDQVITFMSRIGGWDFLNYYLLECVAEDFGDSELQGKVKEYGERVEVFKAMTKLAEFLRVWSSRSPQGSLPDRETLIVKLEAQLWKDCTLADVARQERWLASEFQLEQYAFHFSNAEPGCVCLMWLIPVSAVPLILKAIQDEKPNFTAASICEVVIGGSLVYKVNCAWY